MTDTPEHFLVSSARRDIARNGFIDPKEYLAVGFVGIIKGIVQADGDAEWTKRSLTLAVKAHDEALRLIAEHKSN